MENTVAATAKRGASRHMKAEPQMNSLLGQIIAIGIALAGLALSIFVTMTLLQLPVARVGVSGELKYVSRERISERVAPFLDSGFIAVDLDAIQAAMQDLPWVSRVVVKRQWPDGLDIQVFEHQAIAHWQVDSYVNDNGEVFTPDIKVDIADLPSLSGPDSSQQEVMSHYRKMVRLLQDVGLELQSLAVDERGSWLCSLNGDRVLVFGRNDVLQRTKNFLEIYTNLSDTEKQKISRVDLRYTNGLSVAWRHDSEIDLASR